MICFNKVSFEFQPGKLVLSDFSLTIRGQVWTAIAGPDGSGKSTLARLVKGILNPTKGSISFSFEHPVSQEEIGYISGESSSSIIGITVLDDICFGMENLRVSPTDMKKRLGDVLNWTELSGLEQRLTDSLSGGERQKLALAGILAIGARILILDESFSMMDGISKSNIRKMVRHLSKRLNLTVVEITNRAEDIAMSDQIVFLGSGGRIDFEGTPGNFFRTSLGREWLAPMGGVYGLLSLFTDGDRKFVEDLIMRLDLGLANN